MARSRQQSQSLTERQKASIDRLFATCGEWDSPQRLRKYLPLLFQNVNLDGARVLDVGGGNGYVSYYAASLGADAVCLEPLGDGSNPRMQMQQSALAGALGANLSGSVTTETALLNDFRSEQPFDVIVLNNVINHLNEAACADLPGSRAAQEVYVTLFGELHAMLPFGGTLIFSDAARRNAWHALGIRNPFAPTINWSIHQQPTTWARLAEEAGFRHVSTRWDLNWRLGPTVQALMGHGPGAYFINSHFVCQMRAQSRGDDTTTARPAE